MASSESKHRIRPSAVRDAAGRLNQAPAPRPIRPQGPPPGAATIIEFRGVSMRYPSGDVGLDQATFAVDREQFVFLVGSTGSGKSTLMRLLIKELEPTEGTIRVAGHNLADITRKRVPYYR